MASSLKPTFVIAWRINFLNATGPIGHRYQFGRSIFLASNKVFLVVKVILDGFFKNSLLINGLRSVAILEVN